MFPCLEETLPDERRGKQGKGESHQPRVAIKEMVVKLRELTLSLLFHSSATPSETEQCLEGGA